MSVRHLCQESISHTENSKHSCSCRHMLQISIQLCPSVETPPLTSSFSLHSLQNCPTLKSLHTIAPLYLPPLIQPYVPLRALRSPSSHQHIRSVFTSWGFRSAGPAIWNSLPLSVYILLHHSYLRHICLRQPFPLDEWS